jgi:hypothetical protein
MNADPDG